MFSFRPDLVNESEEEHGLKLLVSNQVVLRRRIRKWWKFHLDVSFTHIDHRDQLLEICFHWTEELSQDHVDLMGRTVGQGVEVRLGELPNGCIIILIRVRN